MSILVVFYFAAENGRLPHPIKGVRVKRGEFGSGDFRRKAAGGSSGGYTKTLAATGFTLETFENHFQR